AFVRPSAPPIAPPTVKGAVPLVVTVRDVPAPPSVTAPVPRFRARVPPNVKSPVHAWALLVASVTGDPLVLSIAPPAIVSVPVPAWATAPVWKMSPAKVTTSDRLKASVPLSTTLPVIDPVVPPAPSCKVPAEITVPPVYVLFPARVVVPVPAWVTLPAPELTPG